MSEDTPANLPVEDSEARAAELQRRLVELEAQSRDRLIRVELKAQAMRAVEGGEGAADIHRAG